MRPSISRAAAVGGIIVGVLAAAGCQSFTEARPTGPNLFRATIAGTVNRSISGEASEARNPTSRFEAVDSAKMTDVLLRSADGRETIIIEIPAFALRPGRYEIVPFAFDTVAAPVALYLHDNGDDTFDSFLIDGGTLTLTLADSAGVTGSFEFHASQAATYRQPTEGQFGVAPMAHHDASVSGSGTFVAAPLG